MTWRGFLAGFVVALILVPLAGWIYLNLGMAPVATSSRPMPFETYLAHAALRAALARTPEAKPPIEANEANYLAGARQYRQDCWMCHGLPDRPEPAIGKGEFPKPPQLFKGMGVTDDPPGETFWKVKNGIRLSGMPGFNGSLSDDQMWQISLLLANADKLPESVKAELQRPGP